MSNASGTSNLSPEEKRYLAIREEYYRLFNKNRSPNTPPPSPKGLSIMIVANSAENYIEECLDSIENQTYKTYQILLCIDSCDKTFEKVNAIKSKYRNLSISNNVKKIGTFSSLNNLITSCRYDHIMHFYPEDIMKLELVEEVMKYIDDFDLIKFDYQDFRGNISQLVNNRFWFNGGVCVYNKKVISLTGGFYPWVYAADIEMIERVFNHVRVKKIEKALYYKREKDNDLKLGTRKHPKKEYLKKIRRYSEKENIKIIDQDLSFQFKENNDDEIIEVTPNPIIKQKSTPVIPKIKVGISVLITAYQSQNFIEECLDSIENQTYFKDNNEYEILLGIDACQETLNKVMTIKDKYRNLSIFMMKENKGTYVTLNTLLDLVKYENILIFGSDDVMIPEMIEKIMYYINDFDVIRFSFKSFTQNISNSVKDFNMFAVGAILYKKSLIDLASGYQPWRCSGDYEFLKRIEKHTKIKKINEDLFYRRDHPNSLSNKSDTSLNSQLRREYNQQVRNYKYGVKVKIDKIVNEYIQIHYVKDILEFNRKNVIPKQIYFIARENTAHFAIPYIKNIDNIKVIILSSINNLENEIAHIPKDSIVWSEWGNNVAQIISSQKRQFKYIVRIHDWEIYTGTIKKINWNNVDLAWFINRDSQKDFYIMLNNINVNSMFLPNAIDEPSLQISKDKRYGKSLVAVSISFKERKGYETLIKWFADLLRIDSEFTLHIKAQIIDQENKIVYKKCCDLINKLNLQNNVFLYTEGWNIKEIENKESLFQFFSNKDIIVSSSTHEGFHYAIAEGMLCGLYPIVFNWEWGRAKDFWKPYVVNNKDEFVEKIINWSKNNNKEEISLNSRKYVLDNFSGKMLASKLINILNPKRIVLIAHHHPILYEPRGAEKSLLITLNYLKSYKYKVYCIVHNLKNSNERHDIIDDIEYLTIPADIRTNRIGYFSDQLSIALDNIKPNVALTYASAAVASYQTLINKKIPYILLVRWFREIAPLPPGDLLKRKPDPNFINEYGPMHYAASSIITNNKYSTEIIRHMYGLESDYSYVPYFKEDSDYQIKGNKFGHILLVTPNKDLGEIPLIEYLAKNMPNEIFYVVNSPLKYKSNYSNLIYKSYVDNMNEVYTNTKILLYIAYNNDVCGTSRVAIEACSKGIPVLCNDRSGLTEVIPFSVSKYAIYNEWIEKINYIINNYDECCDIAYNVYKNYDSKKELNKFINHIEQLINIKL